MSRVRAWRVPLIVLAAVICGLVGGFSYSLPAVQERLEWRIADLRARIKYALSPPQEAVFTPNPTMVAMVQATLAAMTPTAPPASPTPDLGPTSSPTPAGTPTPSPTPIPSSVLLKGGRHEYQKWNNCGPATLAMGLSFWGWMEGQGPVAAYVKPNPRDKNVMPYELAEFVSSETELSALVRVSGEMASLKRFIAAGLPVMIEKGFDVPGKEWMGHYELLVGYDDAASRFQALDSYSGDGYDKGFTLPVPYDQLAEYWRHFNYTYLVIYPSDREAEVFALLGEDLDTEYNFGQAAARASNEIVALAGRDLFFAWYNRGTSLVWLRDYQGAAAAYDAAFQVYATLAPEQRPWRVFWYETGPYFAYFYSGRYYDVINLADQTLSTTDEPALEESFLWRARARNALGDVEGAIEDLRTSLIWHPGFAPSLDMLQSLGVTP
jgi:hypothetical protein